MWVEGPARYRGLGGKVTPDNELSGVLPTVRPRPEREHTDISLILDLRQNLPGWSDQGQMKRALADKSAGRFVRLIEGGFSDDVPVIFQFFEGQAGPQAMRDGAEEGVWVREP